jgi:hypothetical protein
VSQINSAPVDSVAERINRKSMLGKDGRTTRRQENAGDQVKHIVGAIAKHDLILRDSTAFSDRLDQIKLIGITLDAR